MHRKTIAGIALSGALAVGLGAFGAHGLQRITTDVKLIQGYQTGVQYQVFHTLALLALAALASRLAPAWTRATVRLFFLGIFLFSGSLYLITALQVQGIGIPVFLRLVTPLGGLLFIAGWLSLGIAALKGRDSQGQG
jgi:uncharacterized membrane protein YgdD (TMEM256/DUF423 family)